MFFQHEFSFYRSLTDVLDQECFDGLKEIVPEVIERRATILLPSLPLANLHHLERKSFSLILTKVVSPFVSADRGKAFQVKYILISFLAILNPRFLLRN